MLFSIKQKQVFIKNQQVQLQTGGLFMHYSTSSYESYEQRRQRGERFFEKSKTNGSYFEAPLVQKALCTKPVAWRHVFRSFVQQYPNMNSNRIQEQQYLDLTPQQCTTMKLMNISKLTENSGIQDKNLLRKVFRRHYRIDIKQYLKRKYCKNAYELPLEAFQLVRYVQKEFQTDSSLLFKTTYVQIYKPFYLNDNLKRRIQQYQINKNEKKSPDYQIFRSKNLPVLIRQLIKCSVEYGGLDNFIMTTSNVYMEENLQTLQINYTSFAGLALFKAKAKIGAHQFFQITPYLTTNMLKNSVIGVQQRIRFFLIISLCLITKKDIIIDHKTVQQQNLFSFQEVNQTVRQSQTMNSIVRELLKNNAKTLQKLKNIGIEQLITKGLLNNQQLTWQQIMKSVCIGEQQCQENQEKKVPQNNSSNKVQKRNVEYGNFIQKAFKKLHIQLLNQDPQKQFYASRGLDCQLLYIPVKYQAEFDYILQKRAWWEIFNVKTQQNQVNKKWYNLLHESFCFRILNAVLERYKKKQKTNEVCQEFITDPVLQIIFTYLKATQFSPILIQLEEDKQDINNTGDKIKYFSDVYQQYIQLKNKFNIQ